MANIIKVYKEQLPAVRLIGKRYGEADHDASGSFGAKWGEWFAGGYFAKLEACAGFGIVGNDYVGAMRMTEHGVEYWIGCLMAPGSEAPEGYEAVDIPAGELGVCYLYGRDNTPELYGAEAHAACMKEFEKAGWTVPQDAWFYERYNCPRFTTPDEKGNVILDYCATVR